MSVLDAAQRNALKTGDFALPKERAYPIHNVAHAKDALSRVKQYGTPDEQQKVHAAVHKRYPHLAKHHPAATVSPNEAPAKKVSRKPDPSELGSG